MDRSGAAAMTARFYWARSVLRMRLVSANPNAKLGVLEELLARATTSSSGI